MLVDQTIGEDFRYRHLSPGSMFMLSRKRNQLMLLSQLPELLQSMGLSLWRDGSDYLENSYLAYELEPVEDPKPTGGWMSIPVPAVSR